MALLSIIIAVVVGGLLTAFLAPIALNQLFGVNTTTWSTDVVSIWNVLPIILILVILMAFIYLVYKRGTQ